MDQVTFPKAVGLICDKILRAEVGRSEVLDHIVTAVHALFAVRRVSLWLSNGIDLEIVAGWPRTDGAHGVGQRFTFERRPHLAASIAEQKTIIVDIATTELADEVRAFCTGHRVSTIIIVPLVVYGQAIGVLVLDRTSDDPMFDDETMTLCSAVANLAAVAIHNARMHQHEEQLTEELAVATRAVTTSAVLAMVYHQIRNAAVTVGGFSRRIAANPTSPETENNARIVVAEVDRLEEALRQVHAASSNTQALQTINIELVPVIRRVLLRFDPRFSQAGVVVNFSPNGLERGSFSSVLAVASELEIIFENIFENALDVMPAGGTLTIDCSTHNGFLVVTITNSGQPLKPELAERILNPFVTTKESGTGLGLYQVYQILSAWGSTIRVEAPPDSAPKFVLSFRRR